MSLRRCETFINGIVCIFLFTFLHKFNPMNNREICYFNALHQVRHVPTERKHILYSTNPSIILLPPLDRIIGKLYPLIVTSEIIVSNFVQLSSTIGGSGFNTVYERFSLDILDKNPPNIVVLCPSLLFSVEGLSGQRKASRVTPRARVSDLTIEASWLPARGHFIVVVEKPSIIRNEAIEPRRATRTRPNDTELPSWVNKPIDIKHGHPVERAMR